ncbi:NADP-dependent oxidoreductase domain-containing protein [Papiliotrema laurentii]|uniref:NADP-dependent oxidoreductase domain-containing protein n=1 Tax=Papiliotrema laurentii TaxID=5418 RepID=A0AAD9FNJ7_PAPLA|nr:NADP-dependent oxidoreductase domain-containing protein [Papiliotrema laurentii]
MSLPPPSRLGRYRLLAPQCGLRVSPLQLGAMSIGQGQSEQLGQMTKDASFKLLDAYYDAGGNYIDTANGYQGEDSETWVGEWMQKRGNRDDLVIATKYTANYKSGKTDKHPIAINRSGNSYKSMFVSVEASLKKLQTSYIDVLYLHWWDWTTPIEEVMQGLNTLVRQGKVLYLGISDTPAWVISKANQYARDHGLAPFVLYQGRWSIKDRDLERDLLPMCISEGMGIAPWGAIGQGRFQRKADQGKSKDGRSAKPLDEEEKKVSAALESMADQLGVKSVTAVALAYVMSKYPYVYPIIGGRTVEYLKDNITALDIHLTPQQIKELDSVLPFDYGQPMSQFGLDPHTFGYQMHPNLVTAGLVDYVPHRQPIDVRSMRENDDAPEK